MISIQHVYADFYKGVMVPGQPLYTLEWKGISKLTRQGAHRAIVLTLPQINTNVTINSACIRGTERVTDSTC